MIYLDNAATSWPKPENVYQTMDQFLREKGGNPGHGSHSLAVAAMAVVQETRMLAARFIHAPEVERVIFTLNCTDSINVGLKGLVKPGDHVITSGLEHNAVTRPLRKLEQQGVKVTYLAISPQTGTVSPRDVENAIVSTTKLIVMIHGSNVTGIIQPIEEYGAIARRHNLILMVDAAQTLGHQPLDVLDFNIDLLAFSAHKGPLGPPGVGILYIGERVDLDTLREGGTGVQAEMDLQPRIMPNRFEAGTLNSVGIAGTGAGLKYIRERGLDNIQSHEQQLIEKLIAGLSEIPGITLYTAKDIARQASVISFNLKDYEPGEVGAILDQAFDIKVRTGLHCAPIAHRTLGTFPKGTVRLSPGIFNTAQEIEQTLQAINKIAVSAKTRK
jgi:cysteine desulfurase/selenocysteine lyase